MNDTRALEQPQDTEDARRLQRLDSHRAARGEAGSVLANLQAKIAVLRQAVAEAEGEYSVAQLRYDVTLKGCMGRGLVDRDGKLM